MFVLLILYIGFIFDIFIRVIKIVVLLLECGFDIIVILFFFNMYFI